MFDSLGNSVSRHGRRNSFLAQTALRYLVTDMRDAGLPILRRLYETGAVVEPTARENIVGIAATYGWRQ